MGGDPAADEAFYQGLMEEGAIAARAEAELLRCALKGLVDRLDEIVASEDYIGMLALAHAHGHIYRGPNWVDAMKAARAALKEGER